ncbi:MAG: LysR family transcriptional regulator [Pseudomonadota bacterium]
MTLETFIALAQMRHFGKVAHSLNTTQSTVSARIKGLERDLGAELFVRDPSGVALTPKGRELLSHAVQVVEGMNAMTRATGMDAQREGTLRLGVSETLASTFLPNFVQAFTKTYANAKLEIIVNTTTFQRDELLDRTLDLALLMGPVSHPSIANIDLIEFEMSWVAARDHPLAHYTRITLDDLATVPILSYSTTSRPYLELVGKLRKAGITTPRLYSSNALGASVAITRAGLAVATTPRSYSRELVQSGELVELDIPLELTPLRFTASYRTEPGNELARNAAKIATEVAAQLDV